jgi:putative ABC transport system permease protein
VKFSDLLSETLLSLSSNKARSGLTILGIVVGIAAVIVMVAIGQGSTASMTSSIESAGSNLIMVMNSFGRPSGGTGGVRMQRTSLTEDDANAIASEVSGVEAVSPVVTSNSQIIAKGTNTNSQVTGVQPAYGDIRNVEMAQGTFITEGDARSGSRVAVLGSQVATDLFGEDGEPLGQSVRIGGIEFKVLGIAASKGGSGFTSSDSIIYVPLATAQRVLSRQSGISQIVVQAADADSMTQVQADITTLLLNRHNISDANSADFQVMNQADMLATASTIASTMTLLLASIASISLIVGGIGIMNMMLTMVTERTREIGLRKAIGATASDIASQFLAESVMLTFVGGIVGITLGWVVSLLVSRFSSLTTQVSPVSVALAVGVCAAIGIVFGYYPARRAAALNPIEALRYQ